GISLSISSRKGGISLPALRKASRITRMTRFRSSAGMPFHCSPRVTTSFRSWGEKRRCRKRFNAIPKESKPGPRLAVLPDTTTSTTAQARTTDAAFRTGLPHSLAMRRAALWRHGAGPRGGGGTLPAVAGQNGPPPAAGRKPALLPHFAHPGEGRGGGRLGEY